MAMKRILFTLALVCLPCVGVMEDADRLRYEILWAKAQLPKDVLVAIETITENQASFDLVSDYARSVKGTKKAHWLSIILINYRDTFVVEETSLVWVCFYLVVFGASFYQMHRNNYKSRVDRLCFLLNGLAASYIISSWLPQKELEELKNLKIECYDSLLRIISE